MAKRPLEGARILLVQSDGVVAMRLAKAFAAQDVEVVTMVGLLESMPEIGRRRLDAALVHLDLDGVSALPAALLLHDEGVPLVVVAPTQLSALLARYLPGVIALEPNAPLPLAVSAVARAAGRRPPPALAGAAQTPQRQNASPSLA